MVKIFVLVFEESFETAIFPTLDFFEFANFYLEEQGKERVFEVNLVGINSREVLIRNRTSIECSFTIQDQLEHDIIIIPSFYMLKVHQIDWERHQPVVDWLNQEYEKGVELGAMCLGSILLAKTGLLKNRPCTTHWQGCDYMKAEFPEVVMHPSQVVIANDRIYTAGGAFSSFQLILFFIEKYCGKEVAIYLAKMAAVEYPMKTQNQFYVFEHQKTHADDSIITAQDFMEKNYSQPIKMQDLSKTTNMSTRNFIRRFKKATGNTPIEYLQKLRIEAAKSEFEGGNPSVSEVMYNSGYQDLKSFSVLFKRMTGYTPSAYSKRFKEIA